MYLRLLGCVKVFCRSTIKRSHRFKKAGAMLMMPRPRLSTSWMP